MRWRASARAWARAGVLVACGSTLTACRATPANTAAASTLDLHARRYVELVAALEARDLDSASGDSASGAALSPSAVESMPLPVIAGEARRTLAMLQPEAAGPTGVTSARVQRLRTQVAAVAARASLLTGSRLTLDDELRALFGVSLPALDLDKARIARGELDRLLPGRGSLATRLDAFERRFTVAPAHLPVVFERALQECRARTRPRVVLPPGESIDVAYVTRQPWSGFSRYLGGGRSRIEVNLDFALTVDRALELACHEGYPGHHVINARLDQERRLSGWTELGAVPLFSPVSFASEVVASSAASLVFSDEERLSFERDVLFPLARLPPGDAERHVRVARLVAAMAPAITDALLRYLRGERDYIETAWALGDNALMAHPQATLAFVHRFRGFALAYTWPWHALPGVGADEHTAPGRPAWEDYERLLAAFTGSGS